MPLSLSALSEAIATLAADAAPWLAAIRIGPNLHATGIAWGGGLVATSGRTLPPHDSYTLVIAGGQPVSAQLVYRDPALDLALLRPDQAPRSPAMTPARPPAVGQLAVVVAADFDGSPTVRLTAVHRRARAPDPGPVLDMAEGLAEPGGLVLDPHGAVLGMAYVAAGGAVAVLPYRTIADIIETKLRGANPAAPRHAARPHPTGGRGSNKRGWFGIALQPITVPEPLVPRAGQASGRLVVGITTGGPADLAGLRLGDVLLSLDGHTTSGANSLRAFLEGSHIGSKVQARILRDNAVATAWLTVAEQP